MQPIEGMVPVLPTPYNEDETIDAASLRRVVDFCIDHTAAAVCLPAYGGEFFKLSEDERVEVVRIASAHADGRIPVVGQANHTSQRIATLMARQMQDSGADLISLAVPRLFGLNEQDLLRFIIPIAESITVPLLIQDFNPGGATVGAEFARQSHEACPNFQYLKLEEPLMGAKVRAVREATQGQVGVLEGWGDVHAGANPLRYLRRHARRHSLSDPQSGLPPVQVRQHPGRISGFFSSPSVRGISTSTYGTVPQHGKARAQPPRSAQNIAGTGSGSFHG